MGEEQGEWEAGGGGGHALGGGEGEAVRMAEEHGMEMLKLGQDIERLKAVKEMRVLSLLALLVQKYTF